MQSYRTTMGRSADGAGIVTLCARYNDELISFVVNAEYMIQFLTDCINSLPRMDIPIRVTIEPGCSNMKFRRVMRAVVKAMGFKVVNQTMDCCGKSASVEGSLMAERVECTGAE